MHTNHLARKQLLFKIFCLRTGVPRHSAGGIGTFVRTYMVRIKAQSSKLIGSPLRDHGSYNTAIYSLQHSKKGLLEYILLGSKRVEPVSQSPN